MTRDIRLKKKKNVVKKFSVIIVKFKIGKMFRV